MSAAPSKEAPSKPRAVSEPVRRVVNESGIEVKPLYTAEDVAASGALDTSRPGEPPFTRGIHPLMYRHRPWTMRQYTGFANAADTNQRFKYLIANGQTGLNVAFDLATQCGYDSDAPEAMGEVGRVGMAVDTLRDFEIAFDGIDLDAITVSLTINGAAAILIAMYLAMAERRGYDIAKLRGTAQNDILKEFIGRGTWIFPVDPSVKLVADTIEYCAKVAPKYGPVSVCGYHIRESGATPAEEMGYAFSIAKAYTDAALARGLDIDEFAGRLSFNFNIFGNLFEQVAKFRAGRRLVGEDHARRIWREKSVVRLAAHDRRRRRFRTDHRAARKQHHARRLLRADRGAGRSADHGAVLLRRGLHDPDAEGAAPVAAHDAAVDRGDRLDRHGRSARRLLLRRDAYQSDGGEDRRGDEMGRRSRRHRQGGFRRRDPGPRVGIRLSAPARAGERRVAQGRRQLLQRNRRGETRTSNCTPTTKWGRSRKSKRCAASRPSATTARSSARWTRCAPTPMPAATSCRR